MAATGTRARSSPPEDHVTRAQGSDNTLMLVLRLGGVALFAVIAFWLAFNVFQDGNPFLSITLALISVGVIIINLRHDLWPIRWMQPGLVLLALLVIYPMFYTVYIAFTNFSDGHRYTKEAAVELMGQTKYLPEGGTSYAWNVFRSEAGDYALWLTAEDGSSFFAVPEQTLQPVTPNESGDAPYNDDGIPATLNGYTLLEGGERFRALNDIQDMQFGTDEQPIGIKSRNEAGAFESRWVFDAAQNAVIDRETNTPYFANDSTGDFVAADGTTAPLGYWVPIGLQNFTRIFTSIAVTGPLIRVLLWTFAFAFFSVLTSFALGLSVALMLNNTSTGARIFKSLMIIPYAIPGMISILIWRGMLNPNGGVITTTIQNTFGWAPPWYTDPGWAKAAIILVNLWLSFPYFMLICTGALQAIDTSIYEAADVDGANRSTKFWRLTLPLLLVIVGPLLIASFTYNFNNYLLIEALFQGGPTMAGTAAPPVGHTDNLISYTFRFAFGSGGSRDFGFASAIAIFIFIMVGIMTFFQFRLTKRWEEVN
ncbi:MAG: ABC transporter permease subunit [Anaerolineae bacterium]|nr:ABC transporter permease subunit [Anaerolineae bacterium]